MTLRRWIRITVSFLVVAALAAVAMPCIQNPKPSNGSVWQIEVVDSEVFNGRIDMALDSNGYPGISYCEQDVYDLKYASWNGISWNIQRVDTYGHVGSPSSMAIDNNDNPHISYFNQSYQSIKYARWDGSRWINETVDSTGLAGAVSSLALDSNNNPHISYEYDQRDLKYARWNGSEWSFDIIDIAGEPGYLGPASSIALDSKDNPHILYDDMTNDYLRYASWNGSGWNLQIVDYESVSRSTSALAIDSHDNPHIVYSELTNDVLKHAVWNGTVWINETVNSGNLWEPSIALDSNDYPHISYQDHVNFDLKYARWNGSAWIIETVDSDYKVGIRPSIALDSNDKPHIGYLDVTHDTLKYATKAVLQPPPILSYSPPLIDFGDVYPDVQDARSFQVWNSGEGTLQYSFVENVPWITEVSPSHGSSNGKQDVINVSIDTTGLPSGQYAGDVMIYSNGGDGNVSVSVRVVEPRSLTLNIDPDTLNLNSQGRWITAYLITKNARAEDVDASSLLLNDVLGPAWWDVQDNSTLMAKFDRAAVQALVSVSDSLDIKVTGQWVDGDNFEIHDVIRVIDPGK